MSNRLLMSYLLSEMRQTVFRNGTYQYSNDRYYYFWRMHDVWHVNDDNSNKRAKIARRTTRFHLVADWSFAISIRASQACSLFNPTRCASWCTERDWQRQRRDRARIYVDGNTRAFMRAGTRPRPTQALVRRGPWFEPGLLGWFFRREHFRCFRQYRGDDEETANERGSQPSIELTLRLQILSTSFANKLM